MRKLIYLSVHHLSEEEIKEEIKGVYKQHSSNEENINTPLEILLGVSVKQDTKSLEMFLDKMTDTKRLLYMIFAAHSDEPLNPIEVQELINQICFEDEL